MILRQPFPIHKMEVYYFFHLAKNVYILDINYLVWNKGMIQTVMMCYDEFNTTGMWPSRPVRTITQ